MSEGQADRVEELFHQAADLPPQEQRSFLDSACAGDPALRATLERLLADDARLRAEGEAALVNTPLVRLSPLLVEGDPPSTVALPARIGRYRILRLLGEGGMGTVYEAEQENPRRTVALKVIRPGLVTPALCKRFTHEAQILGLLHHPGIAQIYEAGSEDGQPFFAMEFICGVTLDEYARQLAPAARLELVARVCDAVQHAHEQGVIHRDLKPSNILVDQAGQPRVLDFGVARALDADLRTSADHTRTGQLLGTLSYMSPEQVAADPSALDQRSDVYTLGVILFELLAGRLPYRLEHLPLPEMARLIREQEPARLGLIDTRFRGDVETIVAKALEKDKPRRYPSAAELAEDVRRHLRNEPIQARPPSALYQLGKFAKRHKALVVTTAAFLSLLLVGGAVTAWQAVQLARAERDQAVQQARRSREVHDALERAAVLREQARAGKDGDLGKWSEAAAMARRAEALAEGGPVELGLTERVAALLGELDEEEKDRQMVAVLDRIRLRIAQVKKDAFDAGEEDSHYSKAFRGYGLDVVTLPGAEAARRVRASSIREALLVALDDWAWFVKAPNDPGRTKLSAVADGADDSPWRRTFRLAAGRKDPVRLKKLAGDPRALEQPPAVLALLGEALRGAGLPREAAAFLRQAQQRHPGDFWINHHLAQVLFAQLNRPGDALGYYRAALALRPRSAGVHHNLGNALRAQGDLEGAVASYRRALALDPKLACTHSSLGSLSWQQGNPAAAADHFRKTIELEPRNAAGHHNLGTVLQADGDLRGAIANYRRALALDPNVPLIHYNLGSALWLQGDLPDAAARLRGAIQLDPKYAEAHCNLGHVLLGQGDLRAALAHFQTGHKLGSRQKDWNYPSAQWIKRCERFLDLDARLPALLKGTARPADVVERIDLAELCRYKRLYSTSVRFYTEAFAADAKLVDDVGAGHRYQAACSAALAGCGQGEEAARANVSERARLRQQALRWLRANLARRARPLKSGTPQERTRLQELRQWQADPDLAGVRDANRLAALPAAERAAWQQLWADVARALAKGGAAKVPSG